MRGIKTSARVNAGLALGMGIVIAMIFVAAARYIFGAPHGAGYFTNPFYDPATWSTKAVLGGTSIAVLTYIGFDGISTLSEEAENPRRNILLATVLTCVVIGLLSAAEVYVAQLLWPIARPYPNVDTAYVYVAAVAWKPLLVIVGVTLLVANFGSGMGAQLGAARLLYGMGRSNALPKSFFGAIDPRRHIPRNNVLFVGGLALAGAFLLPVMAGSQNTGYGLGAEMLNFGALIAFMGVNAAAFVRYYLRNPEKKLTNLIPPAIGFFVCLLLWLNLSTPAKIAGSIWMGLGIGYGVWKTKGFRGELVNFDIPADE